MAKRRTERMKAKRARKAHRMRNPGSTSNYARKRIYLLKNGGFGFQYGNPKPWK